MKHERGNPLLEIEQHQPMPLEQWFDELIWCPSQCYYHIEQDGVDYILYLRWRWEDPWQAHVVRNAASSADMHKEDAVWSEDVFLDNHVAFRDEELDLAKAKLIELFKQSGGNFPERKRYTSPELPKPN